MTVVQVPRSFLQALDDEERRSFLDDTTDNGDAELKAARYLEERGQRVVEPLLGALRANEIDPVSSFVEGDDPAEVIIAAADELGADIVVMGATRRLFTEEAWKSVSTRVMEKSHLPVLLVPGARIEDTGEFLAIDL